MGELPKNWVGCPAMGNGLIGDRFFTFKTPLSPALNSRLPLEGQLYPENIFQEVNKFNRRLGLWIDLTNTSRYYRKEVIQSQGIEYVKMALEGHGSAPTNRQRVEFANICDNFLRRNSGGIIGVHCTHGFNRTGFLICSYLMFRRKYSAHDAVSEFTTARPPGIYRQNYVNELYDIFRNSARGKDKDLPLQGPPPVVPTPSWAHEGRKRNHANMAQPLVSTRYSAGRHPQQHPHHRPYETSDIKRSKFAEDESIDGSNFVLPPPVLLPYLQYPNAPPQAMNLFFETAVSHQVTPYNFGLSNRNSLLRILRHLCHLQDLGPLLPEPKELRKDNVESLSGEMGTVSWQSTGQMFKFFIQNKNQMFFVGENEEIWLVRGMTFPNKRNPASHLSDTVLIGEMTRIKTNGKDVPAFIISDILCLGGKYVGKLSLNTRRRCLKEEIIQPRGQAIMEKLFRSSDEPFAIRSKPYFTLEQISSLLNPAFQFRLAEPPAYLLFLHSTDPFKVGPLQNAFRWKFPKEQATVNFLLRIQNEERLQGDLLVDQSSEPFSVIPVSEEMASLDGKIIKCRFEVGKWVFVSQNHEAIAPQSLEFAMDVQNNIRNTSSDQHLSKEELLNVVSALIAKS